MPALPEQLPVAEMLLAALALLPVVLAWCLGFFALKKEAGSPFRSATSFQLQDLTPPEEQVSEPLLRLSRIESAAQLRGMALGLRHAPVEQAAPLLRHFMRSRDPELALYAQSTLQQGVERLQTLMNQLQGRALRDQDPRTAASLLETGLRLAAPALCKDDERAGRLRQLAQLAADQFAAGPTSPRLLSMRAEVFLAAGQLEQAAAVIEQLPADHPWRAPLEQRAQFAQRIQSAAMPATMS